MARLEVTAVGDAKAMVEDDLAKVIDAKTGASQRLRLPAWRLSECLFY